MSYYITTDATCDLTEQYFEDNFRIIPMDYTVNGEEHNTETNPMDYREFYDFVRNGDLPMTAQVTAYRLVEYLTPILEQGYDVYHIAFSSGLSATYNSAVMAKKELEETFPDRKIYLIDSLGASMSEGLFVYHALEKRREGASIEELDVYLNDLRDRMCAYFTVDSLQHLVRTGRLSKMVGTIGTALKLKPVLYINKFGHLINIEKAHGRKKALDMLLKFMQSKFVDCKENETIAISDGDAKDVDEFVEKVRAAYPNIKHIIRTPIGPVIGAHSGPSTVALFFVGANKLEKKDPETKDLITD